MKDVIIVLGCRLDVLELTKSVSGTQKVVGPGYDLDERIKKTIETYKSIPNKKKLIIASGGDPQGHGVTEARVISEIILRAGVPAESIIEEPLSMNTVQNAVYSGAILHLLTAAKNCCADPREWRVHVISSDYHIPRVRMIFAYFGLTERHTCTFIEAKSNAPDLETRILHEKQINTRLTLRKYKKSACEAPETCKRVSEATNLSTV